MNNPVHRWALLVGCSFLFACATTPSQSGTPNGASTHATAGGLRLVPFVEGTVDSVDEDAHTIVINDETLAVTDATMVYLRVPAGYVARRRANMKDFRAGDKVKFISQMDNGQKLAVSIALPSSGI